MTSYNIGPEGYLEHIRKAKKALDIPVIASLNGYSSGGWMRYAKLMEEAGADGLELNMYFLSADPKMPSAEVEAMYQRLVANIRSSISIPLAVKLSPFFSALANFAMSLDEAGADALVLFNRFYQPDIDLETLSIEPSLQLSEPEELRLRLRWVGLLAGRVKADLAVTGGVHTSRDVIKSMMAGARVAMTTSALLHHGIAYAADILVGLKKWMGEHEYSSIQQMQGSFSQARVKDPTTFERANYMKVLRTYAANGVPRQLAEGELPII
jgi:dihydroorotate dehydrogenase (fumarate)